MFVDDDVVLHKDCIRHLMNDLIANMRLAAIAADYSHDQNKPGRRGHIAMGATLFRGDVLRALTFRSTETLCECWCACIDLRSHGREICHSTYAKATHLKLDKGRTRTCSKQESTSPVILAAFDRRDITRFEHQFLKSLRLSGNSERIIAIAYGLYPSERAKLCRIADIEWDFKNYNGQMVPIRRLEDFAKHTQRLPPSTPVAYWDVADVIFQDSLADLWCEVQTSPDQLLAVVEPKGYPENKVIQPWCLSIHHPGSRKQALKLLKANPFLNSGFAAGTADVMRRYFEAAVSMRHGPVLSGTTDWGDQMCLNIYCHLNSQAWRAVDSRWNYCVHDRRPGEVHVTTDGRVESAIGDRIAVAHGNARSLRQFAILL
jgi:hypothetical protein